MGKKPFIDKKRAYHFHLVHRSQRDPRIVDDESSKFVLHQVKGPREAENSSQVFQDVSFNGGFCRSKI